jgi:hypothetical protein
MVLVSSEQVYFLKLKTLPRVALKKLCEKQNINGRGTVAEIINRLFSGRVPEITIDRYIREEYEKARKREWNSKSMTRQGIKRELNRVESHIWGMVQGELDAHIQKNYVRNYFRLKELLSAVRKDLSLEVESYVLCTWYNHWTTVVIEDIIAQHPNIVPTIKKVKDTDIFWLGQPWDVKNTNLPSDWFQDGYTIEDAVRNPVEAERYLYELQGRQRFGANNRLFLIIADIKNPDESWKLKRDFSLLEKAINRFFSEVNSFDTVNFIYDKKPYVAHSKILFITK